MRDSSRGALFLLATLVLAACDDEPILPDFDPVPVSLELVIQGLSSPIFLTTPPGEVDRLFVVERDGRIRIVRNGAVEEPPFLDVGRLVSRGHGEQGLLGLAFHPQYASNGRFFVNYTDTLGHTQISRYQVSADPDVADSLSAVPVLTVQQPYPNHNGGMIAFGPDDGWLYIGMGDGGSGGDPHGHGQNRTTLLGDLLRIDVDGGTPYAIPSDNPFVGSVNFRGEIWASGLRNPWRFSFDRQTADLYIGDVGQDDWEEISFQPGTAYLWMNFGWDVFEGWHCYPPGVTCTSPNGYQPPIYEYSHDDGCSVVGGYVYRGSASPALAGRYFFSDTCASWLRSLVVQNGTVVDVQDHTDDANPPSSIVSFGEDADGELYVVSLNGTIHRIVSP